MARPAMRSVGRAERVVYSAIDGNVELTGTPRVQSGLNMHVATSPDTVMVINQSGTLRRAARAERSCGRSRKQRRAPKP